MLKKCLDFIMRMHGMTKENIEKMNENIGLLVVKGREEVKIEPGESLS
jgi:hypothetical protein